MGTDAQDACGQWDSDADVGETEFGHARGHGRPAFTIPEPVGCAVRARELRKDIDAAAWNVGRVAAEWPTRYVHNGRKDLRRTL